MLPETTANPNRFALELSGFEENKRVSICDGPRSRAEQGSCRGRRNYHLGGWRRQFSTWACNWY